MSDFAKWLLKWNPEGPLHHVYGDLATLTAQQHEELASYICTHPLGPAARKRCSLCKTRDAAKDFQDRYEVRA